MKKNLLIILVLMINLVAKSQEVSKKNNFNISVGYGFLYNDLNEDSYYWYKYQEYTVLENIENYSLKVEIPTKLKYLDITFGASYAVDRLSYGDGDYCEQGVYGRGNEYLNGGSIYFGVSPKLKFKYFGLTSELNIGYYTYRHHFSSFDLTLNPPVDVNMTKETSGLGAQINAGVYLKLWRVGVNPKISYILSSDYDASFIFYGFEIPLNIYF